MIKVQKKEDIFQYINSDFLKNDKIVHRSYQINLARSCFNFNSLIVLPTALGKTIIAILVAVKHLIKYQGTKIMVLAPTKPLVMQHLAMFKEMITENIEMDMLIGGLPPLKRAIIVNINRILFSTPQIIKNDLNRGSYDLKDFTLVIFDEAHKARKRYAYTFLAEEYIKTAKKPFILALTASPGKNTEIINELIQKLFIERVCFKTREDIDVQDYIFPTEIIIENNNLPINVIEIQILLKSAVQEIINYFISKKIIPVKNYYSKVDFIRLINDFRAFDLYGENYGEYHFPDVPEILLDHPMMKFTFISKAVSGIYLLHMEEILTTQTPEIFVNYCTKLKSRADSGSISAKKVIKGKYFSKFIYSQLELLRKTESPKIKVAIDIVKAQFREKPASKMIIFCQFREMASIMRKKLEQLQNPMVIPERFVGQFSKPNDKGLTQKRQMEIIQDFKKRKISVLIATSIAEEGLDIPNVDSIIFYEPVPSEIRLIQRRGRTGRHSKGKCHILCAQDTLDEIYMNVAFRREEKMNKILLSEEELETVKNINRNSQKFIPDEKSNKDIYNFFKDVKVQRKISIKKKVTMLKSLKNSEPQKKRIDYLKQYGINDLTNEFAKISINRLEKAEKKMV
ncbi:MAG: helicase-related protein [Promethearchaeota archaeon]